MNYLIRIILALSILVLPASTAMASSHADELESLKQEVAQLRARLDVLEAARSFANFMPDYAERFHVMHLAGERGDWAVAAHELLEIKRLTRLSSDIDADKGKIMQAMMGPSIDSLEAAIEHGNVKSFQSALEQTTAICNSCHTATGSPFINVTLDAEKSLSMRHPHNFHSQKAMGDHKHTH